MTFTWFNKLVLTMRWLITGRIGANVNLNAKMENFSLHKNI